MLGLPVKFGDIIRDQLQFGMAKQFIDGDKKLLKTPQYMGNSNMVVKLDVNYERAVEIRKYIGYIDSLGKLGGLKAIITPVLTILSPIFILVFLLKLTAIIKQSYKQEYLNQLKQFIPKTYKKLIKNDKFINHIRNYEMELLDLQGLKTQIEQLENEISEPSLKSAQNENVDFYGSQIENLE